MLWFGRCFYKRGHVVRPVENDVYDSEIAA